MALRHLIFIFLIIAFLRLPTAVAPFFNNDEAVYALGANAILDGGIMYKSIADQCAPVTPYFYALIFWLFGKGNMFAVHIALLFIIFFTAVLLYVFCRLIGRKDAALAAAFLFSIFSYTYSSYDFLAFQTEWLALFFGAIGICYLAWYYLSGRNLFQLLCGFFFGLAFFSKQIAFITYIPAVIFSLLFAYYRYKKLSKSILSTAINISGFMAAVFLIIGYFYAHNAFGDFKAWFWNYNTGYYAHAINLWIRIWAALTYFTYKGSFPWVNFSLFICFIIAFILALRKTKYVFLKQEPVKNIIFYWLIIFWGLFSYLAASYSGRGFGHYYILTLSPLCILGGFVIEDFKLREVSFSRKKAAASFLKVIFMLLISANIIMGIQRYSYRAYFWEYFLQAKDRSLSDMKNVRIITGDNKDAFVLAEYIKGHSSQSDKIFIWGFYPDIYILSQRRPATRYVNCNSLTGLIFWINAQPDEDTSDAIVPGTWKILMEELNENPPLYFLDTSPANYNAYGKYPLQKYPQLYAFLKRNYLIDQEFHSLNNNLALRLYKRK